MSPRLGTVLYWLGTVIAVLAIVAAVAWNAQTFQARQQAQENLRNIATPTQERQETALAEAFAGQRASTQNLKRSLTFGGVLVLGALFVYGFALAARYAGRAPGRNRDREGEAR